MIGRKGATRRVEVLRPEGGALEGARDELAVEEPLEIRISWTDAHGARTTETVSVTMRTPGDDFELVAGFLFAEGIVDDRRALDDLTYCSGPDEQAYNVVEARLRTGAAVDPSRYRRNFYASSSCGVCGKASLEAAEAHGCRVLRPGGIRLASTLVPELPERLEEAQGTFRRTGGLHAAGLFTATGERTVVREDVGRHNAVDKAVGHALLRGEIPAGERALVVSGRASFEIVQKAVRAGIPAVVAVGAPSTLAVDLARRFGQTLVGFARDGRFNVYAGPERIA
ncbi:MAG TPA: formate dehydrogenase accessory sulfurtransferase FdhD [Longimicrobiales bacterium]|nr:formate dehydrogenase accessory sulfurtransferase FdhD [Longimicrobiales bacterium]